MYKKYFTQIGGLLVILAALIVTTQVASNPNVKQLLGSLAAPTDTYDTGSSTCTGARPTNCASSDQIICVTSATGAHWACSGSSTSTPPNPQPAPIPITTTGNGYGGGVIINPDAAAGRTGYLNSDGSVSGFYLAPNGKWYPISGTGATSADFAYITDNIKNLAQYASVANPTADMDKSTVQLCQRIGSSIGFSGSCSLNTHDFADLYLKKAGIDTTAIDQAYQDQKDAQAQAYSQKVDLLKTVLKDPNSQESNDAINQLKVLDPSYAQLALNAIQPVTSISIDATGTISIKAPEGGACHYTSDCSGGLACPVGGGTCQNTNTAKLTSANNVTTESQATTEVVTTPTRTGCAALGSSTTSVSYDNATGKCTLTKKAAPTVNNYASCNGDANCNILRTSVQNAINTVTFGWFNNTYLASIQSPNNYAACNGDYNCNVRMTATQTTLDSISGGYISSTQNPNEYASCNGNRDCNIRMTVLQNSLNSATFGGFNEYAAAYSPDKVNYTWKDAGYSSAAACQADLAQKYGPRAAASCNTYTPTKEQTVSSIKLGTTITTEVATGALGLQAAAAVGAGSGVLAAGGQVLTQSLAIQAEQSTGNAAGCIAEKGVGDCKSEIGLAVLSWANVGAISKVASLAEVGTQKALQISRAVNVGISGLNAYYTGDQAVKTCFGENKSTLGCVTNVVFTGAAAFAGIHDGISLYTQRSIMSVAESDTALARVFGEVNQEQVAANETAALASSKAVGDSLSPTGIQPAKTASLEDAVTSAAQKAADLPDPMGARIIDPTERNLLAQAEAANKTVASEADLLTSGSQLTTNAEDLANLKQLGSDAPKPGEVNQIPTESEAEAGALTKLADTAGGDLTTQASSQKTLKLPKASQPIQDALNVQDELAADLIGKESKAPITEPVAEASAPEVNAPAQTSPKGIEGPNVEVPQSSNAIAEAPDVNPQVLNRDQLTASYQAGGASAEDAFNMVNRDSQDISKWLDTNTNNGDILQTKDGSLYVKRNGTYWEQINPDGSLNRNTTILEDSTNNLPLSGSKVVAQNVNIDFAPLSEATKAELIQEIINKSPSDGVSPQLFYKQLIDNGYPLGEITVKLYDDAMSKVAARYGRTNLIAEMQTSVDEIVNGRKPLENTISQAPEVAVSPAETATAQSAKPTTQEPLVYQQNGKITEGLYIRDGQGRWFPGWKDYLLGQPETSVPTYGEPYRIQPGDSLYDYYTGQKITVNEGDIILKGIGQGGEPLTKDGIIVVQGSSGDGIIKGTTLTVNGDKVLATSITRANPEKGLIADTWNNTKKFFADLFPQKPEAVATINEGAPSGINQPTPAKLVDAKISAPTNTEANSAVARLESLGGFDALEPLPPGGAEGAVNFGLEADVAKVKVGNEYYAVKASNQGTGTSASYVNGSLQGQQTLLDHGITDFAAITQVDTQNGTYLVQKWVDGTGVYLDKTNISQQLIDRGVVLIDISNNAVITDSGPVLIDFGNIYSSQGTIERAASVLTQGANDEAITNALLDEGLPKRLIDQQVINQTRQVISNTGESGSTIATASKQTPNILSSDFWNGVGQSVSDRWNTLLGRPTSGEITAIPDGITEASAKKLLGVIPQNTKVIATEIGDIPVEGTIDISLLHPHEPGYVSQTVKDLNSLIDQGATLDPIQITEYKGKIYTFDGANRVTATLDSGESTIAYKFTPYSELDNALKTVVEDASNGASSVLNVKIPNSYSPDEFGLSPIQYTESKIRPIDQVEQPNVLAKAQTWLDENIVQPINEVVYKEPTSTRPAVETPVGETTPGIKFERAAGSDEITLTINGTNYHPSDAIEAQDIVLSVTGKDVVISPDTGSIAYTVPGGSLPNTEGFVIRAADGSYLTRDLTWGPLAGSEPFVFSKEEATNIFNYSDGWTTKPESVTPAVWDGQNVKITGSELATKADNSFLGQVKQTFRYVTKQTTGLSEANGELSAVSERPKWATDLQEKFPILNGKSAASTANTGEAVLNAPLTETPPSPKLVEKMTEAIPPRLMDPLVTQLEETGNINGAKITLNGRMYDLAYDKTAPGFVELKAKGGDAAVNELIERLEIGVRKANPDLLLSPKINNDQLVLNTYPDITGDRITSQQKVIDFLTNDAPNIIKEVAGKYGVEDVKPSDYFWAGLGRETEISFTNINGTLVQKVADPLEGTFLGMAGKNVPKELTGGDYLNFLENTGETGIKYEATLNLSSKNNITIEGNVVRRSEVIGPPNANYTRVTSPTASQIDEIASSVGYDSITPKKLAGYITPEQEPKLGVETVNVDLGTRAVAEVNAGSGKTEISLGPKETAAFDLSPFSDTTTAVINAKGVNSPEARGLNDIVLRYLHDVANTSGETFQAAGDGAEKMFLNGITPEDLRTLVDINDSLKTHIANAAAGAYGAEDQAAAKFLQESGLADKLFVKAGVTVAEDVKVTVFPETNGYLPTQVTVVTGDNGLSSQQLLDIVKSRKLATGDVAATAIAPELANRFTAEQLRKVGIEVVNNEYGTFLERIPESNFTKAWNSVKTFVSEGWKNLTGRGGETGGAVNLTSTTETAASAIEQRSPGTVARVQDFYTTKVEEPVASLWTKYVHDDRGFLPQLRTEPTGGTTTTESVTTNTQALVPVTEPVDLHYQKSDLIPYTTSSKPNVTKTIRELYEVPTSGDPDSAFLYKTDIVTDTGENGFLNEIVPRNYQVDVNGKPITGPTQINQGDFITIHAPTGDETLFFEGDAATGTRQPILGKVIENQAATSGLTAVPVEANTAAAAETTQSQNPIVRTWNNVKKFLTTQQPSEEAGGISLKVNSGPPPPPEPGTYHPVDTEGLISGAEVRVNTNGVVEIKSNHGVFGNDFVPIRDGGVVPGVDGTVIKAGDNYYYLSDVNSGQEVTLLTGNVEAPANPIQKLASSITNNSAEKSVADAFLAENRHSMTYEDIVQNLIEKGYKSEDINGKQLTKFVDDYFESYYTKNPSLSSPVDTETKTLKAIWRAESDLIAGGFGYLVGFNIYQSRDVIKSVASQLTQKGYYSPTLGTRIIYKDGKWYRLDNGKEIFSEASYIEGSTISTARNAIASAVYGYQHDTVDQSTFNSATWINFSQKISEATKSTPYDLNLITSAIHSNMTYNNSIAASDAAPYIYIDRSFQNILANNFTICFDYAVAEQTYLAQIGINAELADGHIVAGETEGYHAFLVVTDKTGQKWILDPTGGYVKTYDNYVKDFELTDFRTVQSIYKFTNANPANNFTITDPDVQTQSNDAASFVSDNIAQPIAYAISGNQTQLTQPNGAPLNDFSVLMQRDYNYLGDINKAGDNMTTRGCAPSTAYNALELLGKNPNISNIVNTFYWNCTGRGCATDASAVLKELQDNGVADAYNYGVQNPQTNTSILQSYNGILIYNGTVSSPTESVPHVAAFDCQNGSCASIDSYFSDGKPIPCNVKNSNTIKCGDYSYHVGPTGGVPDTLYPVKTQ